MVRTQIQLTELQVSALRARAASEGVSMAALIRTSVDLCLAQTSVKDAAERRATARAAIGFLEPGPPDLAENHDAYLLDAYAR